MCNVFSFVTEPVKHGGRRFYFEWDWRTKNPSENADSHSMICRTNKLDEDECNKYEYGLFDKIFKVDQINSEVNDRVQAEEWVRKLKPQKVIGLIISKPIVNPFEICPEDLSEEDRNAFFKWVIARRYDLYSEAMERSTVRSLMTLSHIPAEFYSEIREVLWREFDKMPLPDVLQSFIDAISIYILSFFNVRHAYSAEYAGIVKLWEHGFIPVMRDHRWELYSVNGVLQERAAGSMMNRPEHICWVSNR